MTAPYKKFRYVIPRGTRLDVLAISRPISIISLALLAASVAALAINYRVRGAVLNWTIDFQGGTEVIFAANDARGRPETLPVGDVRETLEAAGYPNVEVSTQSRRPSTTR